MPLHARIKPGGKNTLSDDVGYSELESVRRLGLEIGQKK